jgi:hypothetical protein
MAVELHHVLLGTRDEWSGSRADRVILEKEPYGKHWREGRVGRRLGLEAVEKTKCLAPAGNWTPAFQTYNYLLYLQRYSGSNNTPDDSNLHCKHITDDDDDDDGHDNL